MAQIISLSAARKALDRAQKRQQADENAVKFGRTKGQKSREAADALRAAQTLDGAARDTGATDTTQGPPCPPAR